MVPIYIYIYIYIYVCVCVCVYMYIRILEGKKEREKGRTLFNLIHFTKFLYTL